MTLTRDEALQYIHEHPETYLRKARVDGYICPICGSGSGPNGTGITTKDGKRFSCWRGCYTSADIPDIIAIVDGQQPGSASALQRAYDLYGITLEEHTRATAYEDFKPEAVAPPAAAPADQPAQDYSAYYAQAHHRIGQTDYPQRRGLSPAIIERFKLGYDPAWRSPAALRNGKNPPASPRLIIPTGPHSYIARDTRDDLTEQQDHYKKQKEGPALAFNLQALEAAAAPVFVVEGEIDALSVIQAGGEAIGLGGTSGVNPLLKALDKHKPKQPLIIALDKDKQGQEAEKKLLAGLDKLQIPFIQADIAGNNKDPNAALIADPAGFTASVQEAIAAGMEKDREAEAARQERTGAGMVDHFIQAIQTRKYEPMPTGITDIDRAIGGGFIRQQLVLLGAAPGAGKTALAQWIFEGMATRGTACIYLNLEMAQEQILARSISRIVAQQGGAVKTTEILQGYKWSDLQRRQITAAAASYKAEIAPRMIYNPPGVTANLDSILAYMEQEAQRAEAAGEQAPVCVLDYLQLVSGNDREDSAAVIKRSVAGLKAYAIRHNTLVFVIIAHNRESNKTGAVTMEAGRDTSALEYSADLQMALTYTLCMKRGEKKAKSPDDLTEDEKRQVTLKITKGRFGGAGKCVDLHFNGESMTYTQIVTDFNSPSPTQRRL